MDFVWFLLIGVAAGCLSSSCRDGSIRLRGRAHLDPTRFRQSHRDLTSWKRFASFSRLPVTVSRC